MGIKGRVIFESYDEWRGEIKSREELVSDSNSKYGPNGLNHMPFKISFS